MADPITPYAGLTKPTVGADENVWGGLLNANFDLIDQFLRNIVPPGVSFTYRGATAPSGFLLEDGSAVSRSTYASLFAAIGTTYGAGDGGTTFNLPDSRGRFTIGAGPGFALASVGGAYSFSGSTDGHALSAAEGPVHGHGVNDPIHYHALHDPTHNHGVTDGWHGHGVNDPTHAHQTLSGAGPIVSNTFAPGTAFGLSGVGSVGVLNNPVTSNAATGVTVATGPSNISLQASGTGITLDGAYSGVSIQASAGGSPHAHTLTAIPTTPPYLAATRIIKT
jgi:microcystin-dependent protein